MPHDRVCMPIPPERKNHGRARKVAWDAVAQGAILQKRPLVNTVRMPRICSENPSFKGSTPMSVTRLGASTELTAR
jgi:hypothetical protein